MVKSSRSTLHSPSLRTTLCTQLIVNHCLSFSVPATTTPAIVPSASKQDQINPEEPSVNSKKNPCLQSKMKPIIHNDFLGQQQNLIELLAAQSAIIASAHEKITGLSITLAVLLAFLALIVFAVFWILRKRQKLDQRLTRLELRDFPAEEINEL